MSGDPPRRLMYLAVAGAAVLAIGGGAAFYYATLQNRGGDVGSESTLVSVTAEACEPNEITVPGGKRRFEIVNVSDRPIEWEILDGVMVVAERENIAPGFKQTLTTQLAPGEYEVTCGLLSNPRGALHVTDSEEARAAAATVSMRTFLGPLSEYKVYLVQQGTAAVGAAEALATAINAGDLGKARVLWKQARLPYKRIEPLAYRFSDLENAIDPVADYLEKREADPAFIGFHRIEFGLFSENSTDGLEPVAGGLVSDMGALKDRLAKAEIDPALLLAIPGDMANQLAQGGILGGEDHYAQTDLADIAANLEGIGKITGLLQNVVKPLDAELEAEIGRKLDAVQTELSRLEGKDGFPAYDNVDEATRMALAEKFRDLAEVLDRLRAVIGVS
jgi:iron uptake system EfeUOB component EfeO/EfeM